MQSGECKVTLGCYLWQLNSIYIITNHIVAYDAFGVCIFAHPDPHNDDIKKNGGTSCQYAC